MEVLPLDLTGVCDQLVEVVVDVDEATRQPVSPAGSEVGDEVPDPFDRGPVGAGRVLEASARQLGLDEPGTDREERNLVLPRHLGQAVRQAQ